MKTTILSLSAILLGWLETCSGPTNPFPGERETWTRDSDREYTWYIIYENDVGDRLEKLTVTAYPGTDAGQFTHEIPCYSTDTTLKTFVRSIAAEGTRTDCSGEQKTFEYARTFVQLQVRSVVAAQPPPDELTVTIERLLGDLNIEPTEVVDLSENEE